MSEAVKVLATPTTSDNIVNGKDTFLYINYGANASEATPVWTLIGGQRNTGVSVSADEIDASHKTSGRWKVTHVGMLGWKFSADGVYILNDDGLEAVKQAVRSGVMAQFRLVVKDNSGATILEAQKGWGVVTTLDINGEHTDVATMTIEISGSGELQVETNPS